ncbi:MAG: Holliday junction resolvase RuvX [Clostridia bacterium]|nr:Holliday junction resolvase RuvX [Clostridia bacterium]
MRILALDIGDVRIGVAISDPLGISANGIETYLSKGREQDVAYFAKMAQDRGCEKILLGLPLNMDGTEGERAQKVREFGDALQAASGIEVVYEDERLTTVEAEEILIEAGLSRQERRKVIDKVAAEIILRCYLNK